MPYPNHPPKASPLSLEFRSALSLGNTPPAFTLDLQRTSPSTLRQENEGDDPVITAHDADVLPESVSVKLEGDASRTEATNLSLIAERPRSSSESALAQTQHLSGNARSYTPDILQSPAGAPLASTSSLENSTPQRSALPPTPDSTNVPGAPISIMTSTILTSHRNLNSTTTLSGSVKENDGTSTLPQAFPAAPSVDSQGIDHQQTESIPEETNAEVRPLCDPSSSSLPPRQAK
ncbi:hypothetical protein BS47DRAFT_1077629 [Hydnum rufescens UP504]|uniref:Uncharacterized protein n=1 Tax=Hydnum rufescens UP504 TaxID=1448309 RepID=A0A9P6E1Q0_9AGAM|nr:hypothetical protein BS47DRAFT_1077629 [Hydnum rufescens UP504]